MTLSELISQVKVTEDKGTIRDLAIDILGLLPQNATALKDEINEFLIHSKDYREFLDIVPAIERFMQEASVTIDLPNMAQIIPMLPWEEEWDEEMYEDNPLATVIDFQTGKEIVIIKPPV